MNICNLGHEDIVYDGLDCPVCELEEHVDELQNQITVLTGDNNALRAEIEHYRKKE